MSISGSIREEPFTSMTTVIDKQPASQYKNSSSGNSFGQHSGGKVTMIQNFILNKYSYIVHRRFGRIIFALILAVLFCGCASQARQVCMERRTAFDIGSASMKMKTATVDVCRPNVVEIIGQKEIKVPFAENILHRQFSLEIQNTGIDQLQALKKQAQGTGAERFAGAATAAFREAQNTPLYLEEVKNKTGIPIRVISQDEEAILGYQAAVSRMGQAPENVIVWDIGGNSMQITMKDSGRRYLIYRGLLASISFKNQINEKIHHQTGANKSPNPIGKQNLQAALTIAMKTAEEVPDEIKKSMRREATAVIGIGGVHNQSLRKQTGNIRVYRQDDLASALQTRLDLDDAAIGGHYADTDVSNLILVLGFMKKLDIGEVHLMDVNLTDGILVDPVFWQ